MSKKVKSVFSWNPVYNFVMDVKARYMAKFDTIEYKEYTINNKNISCLEYWIIQLNDEKAQEKIKYLEINQKKNFVLIRYGRFSSAGNGQYEISANDLWNEDNGFYRECRSLVLDLEKEQIVIAPFAKFFNLNEYPENEIDAVVAEIKGAKTVEITDKLDGSMQSVRWYDGAIFMAGSQAIDSEKSWRLADGLKMLDSKNKVMAQENPALTFIYEYISLLDAHVVKYTKEQEGLYLIGIRDVETGRQFSYAEVAEFAHYYSVPMTRIFDKTFEEVLSDIKTIKSNAQEGFVINIDGHMIKVKGDDYVEIHKVLSHISSINLVIKSIAENCLDDLYAKVPQAYRSRITPIVEVVKNYCHEMDEIAHYYYEKAPKDNRVTFMVWVRNNVPKKYMSYVRNIYLGKPNNYLKSGSAETPHYKKLNEMGVTDYKSIFKSEG